MANNLGISEKAIRIARMIDRLPDGVTVVRLSKGPHMWNVDVDRVESLRVSWEIGKKNGGDECVNTKMLR